MKIFEVGYRNIIDRRLHKALVVADTIDEAALHITERSSELAIEKIIFKDYFHPSGIAIDDGVGCWPTGTQVEAGICGGNLGRAVRPKPLDEAMRKYDELETRLNPSYGCDHVWKKDQWFTASIYETCTKCGARKEDLC